MTEENTSEKKEVTVTKKAQPRRKPVKKKIKKASKKKQAVKKNISWEDLLKEEAIERSRPWGDASPSDTFLPASAAKEPVDLHSVLKECSLDFLSFLKREVSEVKTPAEWIMEGMLVIERKRGLVQAGIDTLQHAVQQCQNLLTQLDQQQEMYTRLRAVAAELQTAEKKPGPA